jgi:hypothetical protein
MLHIKEGKSVTLNQEGGKNSSIAEGNSKPTFLKENKF